MARGDSLAQTVEATQRSLQERLEEALLPHRDPHRPRDDYAATDTFMAATSRHNWRRSRPSCWSRCAAGRLPEGASLCREYLRAARELEHTLALIKGRLYGQAHAIQKLAWPELWETATTQLNQHNRIERQMVAELILHGDPAEVEGLARHVFDAEAPRPDPGPHPSSPHTGLLGLVARRMSALADRFWDNAEGRVIPEVVHPHHQHDSLVAQYLVADPKFDPAAPIVEHRHRHLRKTG